MSRADRVVARRTEAKRPARKYEKVTQFQGYRMVTVARYADHHKQGNRWWREQLADLVERRNDDGTYTDKPPSNRPKPVDRSKFVATMQPRPEGMTRQVQRKLFRDSCKAAGVSWRKAQ